MWVSFPDLRAVLGGDMAATLCKYRGGVPVYVPHTAQPGHDLAKIVGLQGMAALCERYKGEYITVPIGTVQKDQILQMLARGIKKRDIARSCGVTERYVYHLAGLDGGTDDGGQLTLFSWPDIDE